MMQLHLVICQEWILNVFQYASLSFLLDMVRSGHNQCINIINVLSSHICIAKSDGTEYNIIYNTTASKADHVLGHQFKQRIYKMVESVPWHAHVKAWVDVGLVVAEKPLTKLMNVANELGEYTDYNEWRHALWQKIGDKFKFYARGELRKFVLFVNTHVMDVYRKVLKRQQQARKAVRNNIIELITKIVQYLFLTHRLWAWTMQKGTETTRMQAKDLPNFKTRKIKIDIYILILDMCFSV